MSVKRITVETAVDLIRITNGLIFTVVFKKKDGSLRKMNCRTGVAKGLKGKGHAFSPKDFDLITVFDVKAKQYRMINTATLRSITVEKDTYKVIQ